eukprot:gnl/TRDRNA2_/TRDRNA2_175987_c0_seq1.p1 gnl/TRDRNA2_/TRDRNA2_175987_c0~~gnl/TRDRNA2_/TRDRNA2_175987_c0_seq1.p1  ORF type:complete len:334 (-),score=87.65 gnl/TRDRNA2_/TRDRNA2_175987_c0_seq1:307-1308(-)
MLKFHAKVRELGNDAFYWMCTFAINQHKLKEFSAIKSMMDYPFAKALMMESCQGTLALLDEQKATPFTRTWCIFEDYITLTETSTKSTPHLFDMATILPAGEQDIDDADGERGGEVNERSAALMIDKGNGHFEDKGSDKAGDDTNFPKDVSLLAIKLDVSKAEASNPSDMTSIMNFIGDSKEEVNRKMHDKFRVGAAYNLANTDGDEGAVDLLQEVLAQFEDKSEAAKQLDDFGTLADACQWVYNHKEVVKALLDFKCDPNAPNRKGTFPASYAWEQTTDEDLDILEMLLEANADLNKYDTGKEQTPLELILNDERFNDDTAELLKRFGYSIE